MEKEIRKIFLIHKLEIVEDLPEEIVVEEPEKIIRKSY